MDEGTSVQCSQVLVCKKERRVRTASATVSMVIVVAYLSLSSTLVTSAATAVGLNEAAVVPVPRSVGAGMDAGGSCFRVDVCACGRVQSAPLLFISSEPYLSLL